MTQKRYIGGKITEHNGDVREKVFYIPPNALQDDAEEYGDDFEKLNRKI